MTGALAQAGPLLDRVPLHLMRLAAGGLLLFGMRNDRHG
jgi:uncharacterized membrane protein